MSKRLSPQNSSERSPDPQRKRRYVALAGLCLIAGLTTFGLVWYLTPPPLPETLEAAEALVESPRFQRLSARDKQPYYDVIREQFGSLDPAERARLVEESKRLREAMREVNAAQTRQMLITMTRLPPAMLESMKKNVVVNEKPADAADGGEGQGASLNDWTTESDSQTKQLMGEFMGLIGSN